MNFLTFIQFSLNKPHTIDFRSKMRHYIKRSYNFVKKFNRYEFMIIGQRITS